jgi:hypothetical protein
MSKNSASKSPGGRFDEYLPHEATHQNPGKDLFYSEKVLARITEEFEKGGTSEHGSSRSFNPINSIKFRKSTNQLGSDPAIKIHN